MAAVIERGFVAAFCRSNMASVERCPYCSRPLPFTERGVSTHIGLCKNKTTRFAKAVPRDDQEPPQGEPPGKQAKRGHDDAPGLTPATATPAVTLPPTATAAMDDPSTTASLNDTDMALLDCYCRRHDISKSLLGDVLMLAAMDDKPSFTSADGFLGYVDNLPGPEFKFESLTLPNVPDPYNFAYRDAVDVVKGMVVRHNGEFLDPDVPRNTSMPAEFVDGARYKELRRRLLEAEGPNAVLMPIILSSGVCEKCFVFVAHFYACE